MYQINCCEGGCNDSMYECIRVLRSLCLWTAPPPPTPHTHTTQETESSLRRVQQRMLEAEKRMIQDDILGSNDMLVSSNEFGKPRGTLTIDSQAVTVAGEQ